MSHLAQHRRELLVRLWNELVPRLFLAFRSSSADKIPFSLQSFYPTRGFKGIFCVEGSVGEPIKEQIACELPICFIMAKLKTKPAKLLTEEEYAEGFEQMKNEAAAFLQYLMTHDFGSLPGELRGETN